MPEHDSQDLASRACLEVLMMPDGPMPIAWHIQRIRTVARDIHCNDARDYLRHKAILELLPPCASMDGFTGSNFDAPDSHVRFKIAVRKTGVPEDYACAMLAGYNGMEYFGTTERLRGPQKALRRRWNTLLESQVCGSPSVRDVRMDGPLSGRYNSWKETPDGHCWKKPA